MSNELEERTDDAVGMFDDALRTGIEALVQSIVTDENMTADEKATAMLALRDKFASDEKAGRRMNRRQQSMFHGAMASLKKLFDWSNYVDDDDDESDDESDDETKELFDFNEASGFKVIETEQGLRWLSFSSNAFLDYDKEIFTTAALEDAVKAADDGDWVVSDESPRGPLRLFHVHGADIGDADFQAVVGRFLVESGTFRDDELGQKAVEYLQSHKDEKLQVSIGYRYKVGDEEDGVYDWVRITERSVLPHGTAANPYTSFTLGGDEMAQLDERKSKMLNDWFGETKAAEIIGKAEEQSKELEGTVRFKSKDGDDSALDGLKALAADTTVPEDVRARVKAELEKLGVKDEGDGDGDGGGDGDASDLTEGIARAFDLFNTTVETLTERINALTELPETVKQLQTTVSSLSNDVKEIKESPRGAAVFRATESSANEIEKGKAKEMLGEGGDPPVNPATDHITRLLNLNGTKG